MLNVCFFAKYTDVLTSLASTFEINSKSDMFTVLLSKNLLGIQKHKCEMM